MRSSFVDKLIKRMDRLEPAELQHVMLELLREKGFLEKVFEAIQEGIILLDTVGQITYVNRSAARYLGLEPEQVVGQKLAEGARGMDWAELMQPGTVVSRDLEVTYPETRYLNFTITSIDDEVALGFVMLIRDITENQKLTEEKIESERINAFTLLAAGVAHELGNPLNSLTIHLQLLERKLRKMGAQGAKLQEHLDIALGEIKRLDFIIGQFLAAIRPTEPRLQPVQLNGLLEECLRFLKPELEKSGVIARLEERADLPTVSVDANQMKQAFYNLIRNACQAMSQGGRLTIETAFTDYEVRVSFQDTGKGISAEDMARLFQPFFTTRHGGTGLGLLIVRRIVREHGGEIDIESTLGKGTRVTVFLPLVEKKLRLLTAGEMETTHAS
ncbi:MAG: PAS domain S-box protein [Verrucomicrobiales bacterium]|nr:PAS domain S-box protein [Verrucomicrobiales bacterium]